MDKEITRKSSVHYWENIVIERTRTVVDVSEKKWNLKPPLR